MEEVARFGNQGGIGESRWMGRAGVNDLGSAVPRDAQGFGAEAPFPREGEGRDGFVKAILALLFGRKPRGGEVRIAK